MSLHRGATRLLSGLTMLLGVALIVATVAQGGGFLGIMLGLLFLAAGAGRFYLGRVGRTEPADAPACVASSTRARSSRSPTARSPRRSTSPWA
jgi:hypothetical protein